MRCAGAVVTALLLLMPAAAFAQSFQKPIRIVVPFAPGASADGVARAIANDLAIRRGKPVVVENNVGAGGSLGLVAVAKASPDGDTLGIGASGALLINPNLPNSTAPDLLGELAPIAKLIEVGIVVVANPSVGPRTIRDMIARSKALPQGLTYGSTGVNTGQHLTMELLKQATGANLVHVPYRGSAPAVVDLIGGQIPVAAVDITSAYPHILAGRLRALGMPGLERSGAAPEIATIAEEGVPGFAPGGGWLGLFAPAGTPMPVIKRLSQDVRDILALAHVETSVKALTATTAYQDDVAFAKFLDAESAKWKLALRSLSN
jgi:tripartite-type tricarboxylate transporter receptor subunit TctC